MSSSDQQQKAIDFMLELLEQQGVVCSTVSDGHILMFKRQKLLSLLNNHPDQETISIFIKRPDFKN